MWELDCEAGWVPKNWCFWTVVLEKTLESPLDCKEIQLVHSEGAQPWDFFGRNDAKAETPVLWPPHAKCWLIGKDSDAGRDWGQEEKGMPDDEMAGWHHWLDGGESEWTPGVGDEQGGLACCNSWGCKESETTERLNWIELTCIFHNSMFCLLVWLYEWNCNVLCVYLCLISFVQNYSRFTFDAMYSSISFIRILVYEYQFSQFSCSVMSDSLRPHESQHTRPPCPSPTPGVHSDKCPSSQWRHPAISSSVVPFSSCPQSLPA